LGGLNQTHLKKILAFSSVNHLGWLFIILHLNNNLLKYYFLIYIFIVSFCVAFIQANSLNKINQIFTNSQKIIFIIRFLSLGGLPPFLGFFPKWIVIQQLIQNNFFLINFILIITALITLFYYLQIIITLLTFNFSNQIWIIFSENKINVIVFLISTLTCLGLIFSNINLI
jgi:NADH-ubiquinone oxidoreductase chain 2